MAIPAASSAVSVAIRFEWRFASGMVTSGSFMPPHQPPI